MVLYLTAFDAAVLRIVSSLACILTHCFVSGGLRLCAVKLYVTPNTLISALTWPRVVSHCRSWKCPHLFDAVSLTVVRLVSLLTVVRQVSVLKVSYNGSGAISDGEASGPEGSHLEVQRFGR